MQKLKIKDPKRIERQINKLINGDPNGKFIFRLCSLKILLNDDSVSAESLGRLMQASPRSVSNWIHRINIEGDIDVLRDKEKAGRPARLDKHEMEILREHIQQYPRDLGLDANLWDGKTLSHYIKQQFGKQVQVRQCQRIFTKLGFSLKRGRTVVANGNPKAKKSFKKNFD